MADFVKAHLEQISAMTIAELAGQCDVSTPTVIRFCRTLGCDGFREFKLRLAQNLAVSQQYLTAKPLPEQVRGDTAIDQILGALYASASAMQQQIDAEAMERAKAALLETRHLVFAGIGGGSSNVAQEAANRFFRLGIPAVSTSDSYILQMRAATLKAGDVLFLISASGEADAIVGAGGDCRRLWCDDHLHHQAGHPAGPCLHGADPAGPAGGPGHPQAHRLALYPHDRGRCAGDGGGAGDG